MEHLLTATPNVAGGPTTLALGVRFRIGLQKLIRLSTDPLIQDLIGLEIVIPSDLANSA